jgi:hypothetical protein
LKRHSLLFVILLIALAPSLFSAERRRPVRPSKGTILQGVILDAQSGAKLAGATVEVAGITAVSDANGAFLISGLQAGSFTVTVFRTAYLTTTRTVTLNAGANSIEFRLNPAPKAILKHTNGTTYEIDVPSTEFGYVVTFVGYNQQPSLDVCKPGATEETNIPRENIAAIIGPASAAGNNSCCGGTGGQKIRLKLKNGEEFDAILTDTCRGYTLDVITTNRANGQALYIPLANVASIEFP